MNPQKDYGSFDPVTTRAAITLFRRRGDQFQFSIDGTSDDEEVRGYVHNSRDLNGDTAIGLTAINNQNKFNTLVTTLREMGLSVETDNSTDYHDSIGEYEAHTATAHAPDDITADWNVPHLLIYGSLHPEIQEVYTDTFGHQSGISVADIRNHIVLFGENVDTNTQREFASAVDKSDRLFSDQKRDTVGYIHTADLI